MTSTAAEVTMRRTRATAAMAETAAIGRAATAGRNPVVVVAQCGRGGQGQ